MAGDKQFEYRFSTLVPDESVGDKLIFLAGSCVSTGPGLIGETHPTRIDARMRAVKGIYGTCTISPVDSLYIHHESQSGSRNLKIES
jgi:hypothetical protein